MIKIILEIMYQIFLLGEKVIIQVLLMHFYYNTLKIYLININLIIKTAGFEKAF